MHMIDDAERVTSGSFGDRCPSQRMLWRNLPANLQARRLPSPQEMAFVPRARRSRTPAAPRGPALQRYLGQILSPPLGE